VTSPDSGAEPSRPGGGRHPNRVAALIAAVSLVITAIVATGAAQIDQDTEQGLLEGQTQQAAAVLSSAIMVIIQPLEAVLAVERAAGPEGDQKAFAQYMSAYVGADKTFQSAALWHRQDGGFDRMSDLGAPPAAGPDDAETRDQLRRSFEATTATVRLVTRGDRVLVGYARADPATGWAVYAERALPANRRAPVDNDSAFSQIHYAIYLGREVRAAALTTTDVDPSTLPFDGIRATETVPFGDEVLTVATTPRDHLGADLSRQLPWLLLVAGLLMTAIATRTGQQLARGRQTAEQDAATITTLYQQTETLYDQQRSLFVNLQQALLPQTNLRVPGIDFAADYVAGAHGLDIGGDWYSIISTGEGTFAFVVGDVSGRGVDAVAVMARARFTTRAYLMDGADPATVLEKCAPQFDLVEDGHLVTTLVGTGDFRTGKVTVANAGHPPPVLITGDGAKFVETTPGRPLGTGGGRYESTTFTMPPGSTLFCYTDGLVERRGEDIDAGLERLARVLAEGPDRPVEEIVEHAVHTLRHDDAADDIAALAIRWSEPS
jgi:serine phosphatase RsbU (regulator of sigma subunit)